MKNLEQLHNEAPILKLTVDLYKEFYQYLKTFPKKDQYMLGRRCEEYVLRFTELILLGVDLEKSRKLEVLEEANNKFDVLKVLFRMARELKLIDNKKYLSLEKKRRKSEDSSAAGYDLSNDKGVRKRTPFQILETTAGRRPPVIIRVIQIVPVELRLIAVIQIDIRHLVRPVIAGASLLPASVHSH